MTLGNFLESKPQDLYKHPTPLVMGEEEIADQWSEPRTAAGILRLAVIIRRRIADVEQQARVRLVGISVRHACVAKNPHLHSESQSVLL